MNAVVLRQITRIAYIQRIGSSAGAANGALAGAQFGFAGGEGLHDPTGTGKAGIVSTLRERAHRHAILTGACFRAAWHVNSQWHADLPVGRNRQHTIWQGYPLYRQPLDADCPLFFALTLIFKQHNGQRTLSRHQFQRFAAILEAHLNVALLCRRSAFA